MITKFRKEPTESKLRQIRKDQLRRSIRETRLFVLLRKGLR